MDHPLPYIPPPDYTVRQPSAQAYLAQQQAQQYHNSRDDHGQPHHYVPPPKPRPGLFNGKSSVLEAQDDEPQADVRSEWEVKNKVLRMLSQQGVPVLPGVNLVNVSLPKADESPSSFGPSKAYIKHLENHRKYDTMNSYRTVDNCQICKQMQDEMEEKQRYANAAGYSPASSRSSGYKRHDSPIISGRVYQPPALTSVNESDPQEPMEDADAIAMPPPHLQPRTNGYPSPVTRRTPSAQASVTSSPLIPRAQSRHSTTSETVLFLAKARRSWLGQGPPQLSIRNGETLKVLQTETSWWRCVNEVGEEGWVPVKCLAPMPSRKA